MTSLERERVDSSFVQSLLEICSSERAELIEVQTKCQYFIKIAAKLNLGQNHISAWI